MRNAIASASDAEILTTLTDLAKIQALESPHLVPSAVQQMAGQAAVQPGQLQVIPQNGQQQLNTVNAAQMQQIVPPSNANGVMPMSPTASQQPMAISLSNPSLNLQSLMAPSDAAKQQMMLNQAATQGKEQINKMEQQVQQQKILTNIQMPDEKETQHFLKAQQDEVANNLASEANAKLVKDLKTLSAVLEAKQNLKTDISDIDVSANQKQQAVPTVSTTNVWQDAQQRTQQPAQVSQSNLQVYPSSAKNASEVAYPQAQQAAALNETSTEPSSWSLFGKKKSKQQELVEKEEAEKKNLIKNATQSLDNMLKADSQSEAIKQMTTALGLELMQNSTQAIKRDELFKNATNAIEGLINLRAEEMVKKKEEQQQQQQQLQQQMQQQVKSIQPMQTFQPPQQQQLPSQLPPQQPLQPALAQQSLLPNQAPPAPQQFATQTQPLPTQMAGQPIPGQQQQSQQPQQTQFVQPATNMQQGQEMSQQMQPATAQPIPAMQPQQIANYQPQQSMPQQPPMQQRSADIVSKVSTIQSTQPLTQNAQQTQMVSPQTGMAQQQQFAAVNLQQQPVHNDQMQKMIQDYQQIITNTGTMQPQQKVPHSTQEDKPEVPKQNKFIDFLSSAGKISTIMLSVTPLPTYLGAWGKSKREQVERVESIAFTYILLCILNNSIWTSYAFKIQNIDLAIISVIPLIISVVLAAIYLTVKPESHLIKQFFIAVLVSQVFNFDLLSVSTTGLMGTAVSILSNMIPLSFMPEVIQTRDVRGINMPLAIVNQVSLSIWALYAALIIEPFMLTSQMMGWAFNGIQILFFFWAKGKVNAVDTPQIYFITRYLIKFFSLFAVQQKFKEMKQFFWHDESTEMAQAYIQQYRDDILALEKKYEDREKSFEEHMKDMRCINSNLESISSGKYNPGAQKRRQGADEEEQSEQSTQEGSWNNQQHSMQRKRVPYQRKQGGNMNDLDFGGDQEHQRYFDNQGFQIANNHFIYGTGQHAHFLNDDSMSMNSFNSSINFVKLQNSINFRQTISNNSESTNYFKSRLHNITQMQNHHNYHGKEAELNNIGNNNDSTLILDDIHQPMAGVSQLGAPYQVSQMPKTVQEVSMEDEEQSERCGQEARSSVASLISMIQPDGQVTASDAHAKDHGVHGQELKPIDKRKHNQSINESASYDGDNDDSVIERSAEMNLKSKTKLEDLKNRAQKLKNQKKQKKNAFISQQKMSTSIEMDTITKGDQLPSVKTDLDRTQLKANATSDQLNTFFDHERNTEHMINNNIKDAASDEEDEQALLHGANSSSAGSGAITGSVQMNISNHSPPVDTSQMSISQNKSDSQNLISNSFSQNMSANASGISLKEIGSHAGASSQEQDNLLVQQNNKQDAENESGRQLE